MTRAELLEMLRNQVLDHQLTTLAMDVLHLQADDGAELSHTVVCVGQSIEDVALLVAELARTMRAASPSDAVEVRSHVGRLEPLARACAGLVEELRRATIPGAPSQHSVTVPGVGGVSTMPSRAMSCARSQ